ncbi:MAG: DUF6089 family protein [Sphingobacteriaceae bacterium]|nr:DUF6089 family protein [Sphingobacteriaceae bacterium]
MSKRFALLFLVQLCALQLRAQTWEVGGFVGASGYMGDLNPNGISQFNNMAFGGQVKRNFDPYWSAKLNFVQGSIWASDTKSSSINQQNRKLRFYSPLSELSVQVEFNFLYYLAGISQTRITPFLFTGVGAFQFNPKVDLSSGGVLHTFALNNYLTEGQTKPYKTLAMSIPYGLGVKYNMKSSWNLNAEIGYRTAYTDYLDDVSMNYPTDLSSRTGLSQLLSDPSGIAPNGGQRGDYRKRDTYMFAGLSLTYTFVSRKCPLVGN